MYNYSRNNDLLPLKNGASQLREIIDLIARKTGYPPRLYGKGYKMRCPAHEDKSPSLGVSEGSDGRVLMHCYCGCTIEQICDALGIVVKDLYPPSSRLGNANYKKRVSYSNKLSSGHRTLLGRRQ